MLVRGLQQFCTAFTASFSCALCVFSHHKPQQLGAHGRSSAIQRTATANSNPTQAVQMWEPLCRIALHRGHLGGAGYLASRRAGDIMERRLEARAVRSGGSGASAGATRSGGSAGRRSASPGGRDGGGSGSGRDGAAGRPRSRRDGSPGSPHAIPERPVASVMRMPVRCDCFPRRRLNPFFCGCAHANQRLLLLLPLNDTPN